MKKPMINNASPAVTRAADALAAYGRISGHADIPTLLADLQSYCFAKGLDFEALLATSRFQEAV